MVPSNLCIIFLLANLCTIRAVSMSFFPNEQIIPASSCVPKNFTDPNVDPSFSSGVGPLCPRFHDGLACWSNQGNVNYNSQSRYYVIGQLCPTITSQLTVRQMYRYCSQDSNQWINPLTNQPDMEYVNDTECYPNVIKPNFDERRKLNELTVQLRSLTTDCILADVASKTYADGSFTFRNLYKIGIPYPEKLYFLYDGIVCFTAVKEQGFSRGTCPQNSDFFEHSFTDELVRYANFSETNTDGYSIGWSRCLRDDYKVMLKKFGLDVYFKEGCTALEYGTTRLPLTRLEYRAYTPCSLFLDNMSSDTKYEMINNPQFNFGKYAAFYCNNFGAWEGNLFGSPHKECYSDAAQYLLEELKASAKVAYCPPIKDKIVGEWPATVAGQSATVSCEKVLTLLGYTLEQNDKRNMLVLKRFCNQNMEWEKIDWSQCIATSERTMFFHQLRSM